jgi:PilX N-terminal
MMKKNPGLKNEDGSVLVVALIILVVLTLLGIAVTTTTEIETQIAGNEKVHNMTFYNAEAAAMQCAQVLETTPMADSFSEWINLDYNENNWDTSGEFIQISAPNIPNAKYTAVYEGVADTGESLDMAKAKIHSFSIYGRAERSNSVSMIKLGYRKAY